MKSNSDHPAAGSRVSKLIRLLVAATTLGFAGNAPGVEPAMEVAPGTVVRWSGDETVLCAAFDRVWAPIGASCYFPIDMLTPEGDVVLERVRKGSEERRTVRVGSYPYPTQHLTVDPGMVHLTPQNEERHERERANIVALWDRQGPARFMLPLNPPLKNSAKGKNFGSRRVFNNEPRSPHSGIDYSARKGTSILSAETGIVALAENHYFAGNSVFIDHGGGLITMYFHLDKILVRHGDTVDRG
ncbi:MAG: M23 family metallopeptidase, partial [bacterium]|nr:M23 family metallopeptidase [bacterium]